MSKISTEELKELINDFNTDKYDLTNNGECTGCGKCCSNILPMTTKEVEIIKKYIVEHDIKPTRRGLFLSDPSSDLSCPFLNNNKKDRCNIYKVRPLICRSFSCHSENRKNKVAASFEAIPMYVREVFFGIK